MVRDEHRPIHGLPLDDYLKTKSAYNPAKEAALDPTRGWAAPTLQEP
jgi:hypothetical protein